MKTILENLENHEIEYIDSQVVVRMLTGIDIPEQLPGREGNGYRIINMYYPRNPAYEANLARAGL